MLSATFPVLLFLLRMLLQLVKVGSQPGRTCPAFANDCVHGDTKSGQTNYSEIRFKFDLRKCSFPLGISQKLENRRAVASFGRVLNLDESTLNLF